MGPSIRARMAAGITAGLRRIASQTPVPLQHADTTLGLSIAACMVLLIATPIYFGGHQDIDEQPLRQAIYNVDINTHRWAELANLPRIGEKTAKRIIQHGDSIGGFETVEQLTDVKGIGPKTLAGLRTYLINQRH